MGSLLDERTSFHGCGSDTEDAPEDVIKRRAAGSCVFGRESTTVQGQGCNNAGEAAGVETTVAPLR
jgi:hypothetical protein